MKASTASSVSSSCRLAGKIASEFLKRVRNVSHQLARRLFFANQGAFQTRDYEEMMNKASCLSLLCNAVLVWNTVHMSRIIEQLRATGVTVTDEDVALISPLAYAHVIPNGTYFFDRVREADTLTPARTC
jgi:hypothetical protein